MFTVRTATGQRRTVHPADLREALHLMPQPGHQTAHQTAHETGHQTHAQDGEQDPDAAQMIFLLR